MYNKIPKNWEKVKLKKYIEIVRGVNYKSNEVYDYKNDNTTGILRANNISNNGMFNFEKIIYVDNKNIKNEQMIKNGDIVIAMSSGSKNLVGKAAQAKQNLNFAFGAFCSVVRPKNINSDFLGFYFLTDYYRNKISELSTGININNLRKDYIENLDIMVPLDPKEQEKIVQVLDTMSNIIRLREKCISHAQDLIPALFQEMFGDLDCNNSYKKVLFGDIITVLTDYHANGSYEKLKEHVTLLDNPDYALMVRTTDLEKNNFIDNVKYISQSAYEFLEKSKIYGGEIIINKIGSAGNVYLMPKLNRPVSLGMNAFLIRIDEKCANNIFIYNLLTSLYGKKIIQEKVSGAVTKTITKNSIRSLKLYLPPVEQQELFAEKAQEIEAYIKTQQAELENAKQMFQSLLHHAFTGELTRRAYGKD